MITYVLAISALYFDSNTAAQRRVPIRQEFTSEQACVGALSDAMSSPPFGYMGGAHSRHPNGEYILCEARQSTRKK